MMTAMLGVLLIVAGLGLTVWTASVLGWRRLLGRGEPAGRPPLVLSGPYRVVRHPAHLGLLLLLAGAALATGVVLAWVLAVAALLGLPLLARREEKRLERRFGEAYRRYQRNVRFL